MQKISQNIDSMAGRNGMVNWGANDKNADRGNICPVFR